MNRELGAITVVITHNAAISAMADSVVHISSGSITGIERHATRASPSELPW